MRDIACINIHLHVGVYSSDLVYGCSPGMQRYIVRWYIHVHVVQRPLSYRRNKSGETLILVDFPL